MKKGMAKNHTFLTFLFLLLLINVYLRFSNLKTQTLVIVDEINLLVHIKNKVKGGISGSYLPTIFLSQFFQFNNLLDYRYFTATLSLIGIMFFYIGLFYLTKNVFLSFFTSLILSINGFILYTSRLFISDWSDIFFPCLLCFFFSQKLNSKTQLFIILSILIGMLNHSVMIYTLPPALLYSFFYFLQIEKKEKNVKKIDILITIFLLLFVSFTTYLFVSHILSQKLTIEDFLKWRYNSYDIKWKGYFEFTNLLNFKKFIYNFSSLIIFEKPFLPFYILREKPFLVLIIILVPIFLYIISPKNDFLNYIAFICYGIFIFLVFSFIPAYHPTHFIPFFIIYLFFLSTLYNINNRKIIKAVILALLFLLFISGFYSTCSYFKTNSYNELKRIIISENITQIKVEEMAYEIMKIYSLSSLINVSSTFRCTDNGLLNFGNLEKEEIVISHAICDVSRSYEKMGFVAWNMKALNEIRLTEVKRYEVK